MHVRLLALGTIAALCAYGCAQNTAPVPVTPGAASSRAAPLELGRPPSQPGLKLFDLSGSGSWPDYIVSGPGHAMWFTEFYGNDIGRVSMDGTITNFTVPGGDAEGITIGGDGNIWFTEPGYQWIVRMTPSGTAKAFQLPVSQNESPRGITLGPDGNVWWAEFYDGYIGRITPQGKITRFAIPGAQSGGAWDIKAGPNGYLYVSEAYTNQIVVFDPRTSQFKPSIAVPTKYATPWGLLYAPDKHIWFTERNGNKIAEVSGGTVREFSIPQTNSYPEALAAGADGKLWFTEGNATSLNEIDPKTGKFGAGLALPSGSIPNGIAPGPNGKLWFCIDAYSQSNQIGELMIR